MPALGVGTGLARSAGSPSSHTAGKDLIFCPKHWRFVRVSVNNAPGAVCAGPGNPTEGVSMRPVMRGMLGSSAVRIGAVSALVLAGLGSLAAMRAAPAANAGGHCSTSITKQNFGTANSGPYGGNQTVFRYTLTNSHCMQVRIITYGATVQSISVPDRHGHLADVALGFKTLAEYVDLDSPPPTSPNFGGPYFGETIGRYANRIGGASFKLNGTTYTLPVNNGPNTLHGGFVGWGNRICQHPTMMSRHGPVSLTSR